MSRRTGYGSHVFVMPDVPQHITSFVPLMIGAGDDFRPRDGVCVDGVSNMCIEPPPLLDVDAPDSFTRWLRQPETDGRTLQEFCNERALPLSIFDARRLAELRPSKPTRPLFVPTDSTGAR